MILRIILSSFSFLLLAAHFSRADNTILIFVSLLAPFLFFYRKSITLIIIQLLSYAGAVIWLVTMYGYIQERIEVGRSWTVLLIILTSVALFTALSGVLLNSKKIKEKYC